MNDDVEKPEGGTDSCPAAVQAPPERTAGLERVGCCWRSESAAASRPDGRQPPRGRPRGGQKTVVTTRQTVSAAAGRRAASAGTGREAPRPCPRATCAFRTVSKLKEVLPARASFRFGCCYFCHFRLATTDTWHVSPQVLRRLSPKGEDLASR